MLAVRLPRLNRHLLAVAVSTVGLLTAGAASGAPGLYPLDTLATPHPNPVPNTGTQAIAFVNSLLLSVAQPQPGSTNTSAGVPLCLSPDERRVGHAYAIKETNGWVPYCYAEGTPLRGARILKPLSSQSSNIKWVAMRKGQALPRQLAAVAFVEANRVPVYACKDGTVRNETVGTLLPDGSCRLAKTLTSDAKTVEVSQVLIHSATGDASPAYGFINTKEGAIPPGGELLKWPNGAVYCTAGGYHGVLKLHEANAIATKAGTIKGCELTVTYGAPIGTSTKLEQAASIKVLRNDGQSGVAFQADVLVGPRLDQSARPEVSTGAATAPCYADGKPGYFLPANTALPKMCRVAGRDSVNFLLLRRVGNVPGEGGGA